MSKAYKAAMRSAKNQKTKRTDRSRSKKNHTRGNRSVVEEFRWFQQSYDNTTVFLSSPEEIPMEIKSIPKGEVIKTIEVNKNFCELNNTFPEVSEFYEYIQNNQNEDLMNTHDYDNDGDNDEEDEFAHLSDEEYRQMVDDAYEEAEKWSDF